MTTVFKILYWLGVVVEIIIRAPHEQVRKKATRAARNITRTETLLLSLLWTGSFLLPLVYSVTPWLDFANYMLPAWLGWLGAAVMAAGLVVFWRAHRDLQANWSPSLEIFEGHRLVTSGIYRVIRHPMYASQWLFATAQALLLQNWIAGLSGLVVFIPFYLLRVQAEEQMMLATFGEEYRRYMQASGRVLPKL